MQQEKKEFAKCWLWVSMLVILTIILLVVVSAGGKVASTIVEREVFEQSYQKRSADKEAIATYNSQLQILQRRYIDAPTREEKAVIQAQMDSIKTLLATKEN